ncbi:MAG TPA: M48 family metallopeptidase [Longimicrobiales bacterium]|nr:M48 family metallopeptidase [Longimicrobiales bacterium]
MLSKLAHSHRGALAALLVSTTSVTATCAISPRQEVELGQQYAADINRQLPIVTDPALDRYINAVGNQLAQYGQRNFGYRFYIVNTDQVNAFSIPGGFIYINRGLIEQTNNLSELAGVLAHEIAHVEERHGAEQIERMQRANVGLSLAYILLGRAPSGLERAAIEVGGAAIFARYSREAEFEADATAVRLLVSAGINPNGLATFFSTLLAERERQPGILEQWFSTHPTTEDRIAQVRSLIRQYPPETLRGLTVNTEQFNAFKARVQQLPPPPARFRTNR